MNDFDTKFIALKEIKVTHNPENPCSLRLEENFLVSGQEGIHTKKLETNKKRKIQKKIHQSRGNSRFLHILGRLSS